MVPPVDVIDVHEIEFEPAIVPYCVPAVIIGVNIEVVATKVDVLDVVALMVGALTFKEADITVALTVFEPASIP